MSIIAINDNIVLTLAFHKWFVENVVAGHSKWLCKTKLFSVHVFACYGAFQIVLMTLDKVIAIKLIPQVCIYLHSQKSKTTVIDQFYNCYYFVFANLRVQ